MNKDITNVILASDSVDVSIKILIVLSWYDYYKDYYIPNQKLQNKLGLSKRAIQRGLATLKARELINIYYHGPKRHFSLNNKEIKKYNKDKKDTINNEPFVELFDYNWLN